MFEDRLQAGILLSKNLLEYKDSSFLVLAIPRGGVVVAKEVTKLLNLPLDIIVTRKLAAPSQEELAIGAIGPKGVVVLDSGLIRGLNITKVYIEEEADRKIVEVVDRLRLFRLGKRPLYIKGRSFILVDDGIATGATVQAAVKYLRKMKAKRIILAVPVAPRSILPRFKKLVDKLVVLKTPTKFRSVGQFYKRFPQVTNEEVVELLK